MQMKLIYQATALTGSSLYWLSSLTAIASPVVSDADATIVTQSGNQFEITGGITSADGQALFHTFQSFGLTQAQAATFLAQPEIQSILGSVAGGQASYIDGLLQVTGSPADLYLINPAGILLGPNAQLDLAGSFAATTASGVLFDDAIFHVLNGDDFSQFAGMPTGFAFAEGAGAIVNAAHLNVAPGESITLIGDQVISTGTLTAPGGDITIAAVSDSALVRISQSNLVLSLEIAAQTGADIAGLPFAPTSLPELLTGGDIGSATGIMPQADGTITLVDTTVAARPESTIIAGGSLDTRGELGGQVTLVGDRVSLLSTEINASGTVGGGTVRVGGDREGQSTLPGSSLTYMDAESAIAADSWGNGDGGTVILWSDGATAFGGRLSAQGGAQSGNGGFVEVSGAESLVFRGEVVTTAPQGQTGELLIDPVDIVIRNGAADGDDSDGLPALLSEPGIPLAAVGPTEIYESELEGLSGDTAVTLRASNRITIEDLADNELVFQARLPLLDNANNPVTELPATVPSDPAPIRFEAGGDFAMATDDAIVAPGRDVVIQAGGNVTIGTISTLRDGTAVDISESLDGSIRLTGVTVTAGVLNALQAATPLGAPVSVEGVPVSNAITGLGAGNVSNVTLTSTSGDIVVEAILAGAGGVVVNSAGQFQATGTFPVRTNQQDGDGADDEVVTPSIIVAIQDQVFGEAIGGGDPPVLSINEVPITVQRGTAIAPDATPGVHIAIDALETLGESDLAFFADVGTALSVEQSGTFKEILHIRPDRVLVTRFENQAFTLDATVAPPPEAGDINPGAPLALENPVFVSDTAETAVAPETVANISDIDRGGSARTADVEGDTDAVLEVCEEDIEVTNANCVAE
ncbi:MAG: filamentous hemagglutinin N-terminal domain-containing protein [Leptolyngbyaceae cyanobacterium]